MWCWRKILIFKLLLKKEDALDIIEKQQVDIDDDDEAMVLAENENYSMLYTNKLDQ